MNAQKLQPTTVADALEYGKIQLGSTPSALLDTEVILGFCLHRERTYLFAHPRHPLLPEQQYRFRDCIQRRKQGTPVAYITGTKEFCGLTFAVTPDVLIPRPETETMLDILSEILSHVPPSPLIADIGTGSGCIAVSAAVRFPLLSGIVAVDISPSALRIARANAHTHNVHDRIMFLEGNLADPLISLMREQSPFQRPVILLANLPYLAEYEIKNPTLAWEPHVALAGGGAKGENAIINLLDSVASCRELFLAVILEINPLHVHTIAQKARGIGSVHIQKDLAGHDRFLLLFPSAKSHKIFSH